MNNTTSFRTNLGVVTVTQTWFQKVTTMAFFHKPNELYKWCSKQNTWVLVARV